MKISNKMQHFLRICFRNYFIIQSAVIFVLFSISLSDAKMVTFEKEYTYQASELDSKASCRTISLEMVKRLLLEELGTYLISETEVRDFKLTKEQIKTYSAGIVGAEIIEDKWDGKTYWLKAKVSADPKEMQKSLKKIIDDKYQAKQLEDTRKKAEELTKEVERLNKELAKAEGKQPSKKIQQEYKKAIEGLSAVEWFERGNSYDRRTQNDKAIEAYTNAIALNPKFVEAYLERSSVYYVDSKFDKALQDVQEAIRINPKYLNAYIQIVSFYNLMAAPFFIGEKDRYVFYQNKIIEACNKLIKLQPKTAMAYLMRGRAYKEKGDLNKALSNFNKINSGQFHPNPLDAHQDSGDIYVEMGQYTRAIDDYTKAIDARKKYMMTTNAYAMPEHIAYPFIRRGYAYLMLKTYSEAINDFTIVIDLKPDNAMSYYLEGFAYYYRGLAYDKLGNHQQAIENFKIAARLGHEGAQDFLREMGISW